MRGFLWLKAFMSVCICSAASIGMAATDVRAVLDEAYLDELKAYVRYEQVIAQYGEIRPFVNLLDAERRHLDQLSELYISRGWTPVGVYEPVDLVYLSVAAACQVSLDAEKENVALFDKLLPQVSDTDVVDTFQWLRQASAERHIPALARCAGVAL